MASLASLAAEFISPQKRVHTFSPKGVIVSPTKCRAYSPTAKTLKPKLTQLSFAGEEHGPEPVVLDAAGSLGEVLGKVRLIALRHRRSHLLGDSTTGFRVSRVSSF